MNLSDLKPFDRNPRKISEQQLKDLKRSLQEFGDLSGFVYNRQTDRLVGAHQRKRVMPPEAEIVINQKFDQPTKVGTIALGFVLWEGEQFQYREVMWDETKEKAANLAANKHGGEFDMVLVNELLAEIEDAGFDIALTGFGAIDRMLSDSTAIKMSDKFIEPPFSILNARGGNWQKRKRTWISMGIRSELGRGGGGRHDGELQEPGKTLGATPSNQKDLYGRMRR